MELTAPLQTLKGIGPKTATALEKAGLRTIADLLYYLPRTYENYQATTSIANLRPGKVMLKGRPDALRTNRSRRRNLSITEGVIRDNTGVIRVVWFNQPYRARQLDPNKEYYFTGTYDFKYGKYQLTSPTVTPAAEVSADTSSFQPIYSAKNSLKPLFFKKTISSLRPSFAVIPDLLPLENAPAFVKKGARAEALFKSHFPATPADVKQGRTYLAYEELFEFLLAGKLNKQDNQKLNSITLPFNAKETQKLVQNLPFTLTNAQKIATWDILRDLEKPTPMNRLLQGDVGSGKTVVAAIAAHQSAKNGHQTAILAPTAILAAQHASGLSELLGPLGVKVALLTGATKNKT
ncbi:DEAD/DEAH box helicase [Candidatus Saccharibacteria bacterium]|nr:DEAD/DEAH box helicase [Candidatus Saccharibacteria bacterium]